MFAGHIVAVDSVSPTVFCIAETGDLIKWFDCANYMREPSDIAVNGKEYFVCDFKVNLIIFCSERSQSADWTLGPELLIKINVKIAVNLHQFRHPWSDRRIMNTYNTIYQSMDWTLHPYSVSQTEIFILSPRNVYKISLLIWSIIIFTCPESNLSVPVQFLVARGDWATIGFKHCLLKSFLVYFTFILLHI